MIRTVLKSAAPALALAAVVLLPFVGSSFTIDDTLFLEQATHALRDPLHPTAFETVWSEAGFPRRMSSIMPSGAVAAWVLVPAALAGGSEEAAHLTQLLALAAAVVATVSLALRLGLPARGAAVAGLLLAATPAALGMAGTAMPDVVAMALGVAGVERLVAWKRERRVHQGVAAALLLGLAPLARSQLLLVLPVAGVLLAAEGLATSTGRGRWTPWLPLAGAVAVAAAVAVLTRDPSRGGGDLASSARTFSAVRNVVVNSVAFTTHWITALPLGLPWLVLRGRAVARRWWVPAGAAVGAAAALHLGGEERFVSTAVLAALGAAVLVDVLVDALARRDRVQLALGLWLLVAAPIVVYLHLPSKYLLASAPAAALLVARLVARSPRPLGAWVAAGAVVAGSALGVAILRADEAFASVGRRAAAEVIAPRVAAGDRVWFAGSWGFKWYAAKAGGRTFTVTPPYPKPGDLLVVARRSEPNADVLELLQARYPRSVLVGRFEEAAPGGRTMSAAAGAGFFSNGWGYLPWSWGDEPLEEIDVVRLQ